MIRSHRGPLLGALLATAISTSAQRGPEPVLSRLFTATSAGPFKSYSWGEHWEPVGRGLAKGVRTFVCIGPRAFAAGADGLFASDDYGESWSAVQNWTGGEVLSLLASSYFPAEPVVFAGTREGLYRSGDGGEHWERLGEAILSGPVFALAWPGPSLFAAGSGGLFLSPDGGKSWSRIGQGLPGAPILCLALSRFFGIDPVSFAGLDGAGVYRSRDAGERFTPLGSPAWAKRRVHALFWWESSLFAATDEGLFISRDAGESWHPAGGPVDGIKVYSLSLPGAGTAGGSDILAGTERGVFKSSDGALTWRHLTEGMGEPEILGFGSFPFPTDNAARRRKR